MDGRTGECRGGLGFSLLLDNGHFQLNQHSLFPSLSPGDIYTLDRAVDCLKISFSHGTWV